MANYRIAVTVSDEIIRSLDSVAQPRSIAFAELLRKALTLYTAAKKAQRDHGFEVCFYDPGSMKIEVEVINL
ncbi:hypothetical protein [Arenimonas sp.]|uniref:hypothetical protein n=1 Tax=Arenimonas sp. TaxID=1872635 RepID=UPI0035B38E6C